MKNSRSYKKLRKKANERLILQRGQELSSFSVDRPSTGLNMDRKKLLSELSIHQIELEIQNDELRESRAELERAKEWYFTLFDLAPIPYFVFSRDHTIRELNFAAAQLLRKDRSACKSSNLGSYLDAPSRERLRQHFELLFEHKGDHTKHTINLRLNYGEDEFRDLELTSYILEKHWTDEITCLSSCMDITERNQTLSELRKAKVLAESAAEAKTEFLANMSHEIRTPLTSVLMFSQLLQRKNIPDVKKDNFINGIIRNASHLNTLIGDILDLSKLEAGHLTLRPTPISLEPFLDEVTESLHSLAAQKQIQLTYSVAPEITSQILADSTRLRQILINLVGNAIKFTPNGSVKIAVKLDAPRKMVCIEVQDTGIGIAPEAQENLFRQFSQADGSTTRRFGGTGLGLYLSRKLAEAMEGDLVLVSSLVNVGTTFRVSLPYHISHNVRVLRALEPPKIIDASLEGCSILVVEDTDDTQAAIQELLLKEGAKVEVASNGEEALAKYTTGKFDLILMDIHMPGIDGIKVTEELRFNGCKTPIIGFTANTSLDFTKRALDAGFNECLNKPLLFPKLKACFLTWLKARS